MNLISCKNCGAVYNSDDIDWPDEDTMYDEDKGEYDPEQSYWNGKTYVPMVKCKVCNQGELCGE